ncbi:MAG TPA: DUF1559 domain-containing protein [Lacipirellulaceae bacterium]
MIAIIGVLVALILPAIQVARESARKTTCKNNLKQICLATIEYSTNNQGRLPASWETIRNKEGQAESNAEYEFHRSSFSWRTSLLPFLGEQALYDRLNFSSTPIADDNAQLVAIVLGIFQCPSTPDSPRSVLTGGGKSESGMGANDYSHIFFVGVEEVEEYNQISGKQLPGAWYGLARYEWTMSGGKEVPPDDRNGARGSAPLRYATDGLSHTILIAEKAGFPNSYVNGRVVEPSPWGEGVWAAGEFGGFGKAKVNWSNFPSMYSFHTSGSHVALCDGSVRILSDDTATEVVKALCSRDGGETD